MTRPDRETRRLREIAREYESQGYRVVVSPRGPDLPDWLQKLRPDLLAAGNGENVVVEVRSSASIRGSRDVFEIAEMVDEHPEWRFELVVSNPRIVAKYSGELLDDMPIDENLRAAHQMVAAGLPRPGFIVAWAAFEAAARQALARLGVDPTRVYGQSLLKTLFSFGFLASEDELEQLQTHAATRNSLVHGFQPRVFVDASVVLQMIETTQRLLNMDEVP